MGTPLGLRGTGGEGVLDHHRWILPAAMGMRPPSCQVARLGPTQHSLAKDEYESQVGPLVVSEARVDLRS